MKKILKAVVVVGVLSAPVVWWQASAMAQRIVGSLPTTIGNLAAAKVVEIRDGSDQVVLRADWVTSSESKDEVERTAMLGAAGSAHGKAEIELERSGDVVTKQEIEVTLKQLSPQAGFKLYVDGIEVAAFSTTKKGNADLKFSRKVSLTRN